MPSEISDSVDTRTYFWQTVYAYDEIALSSPAPNQSVGECGARCLPPAVPGELFCHGWAVLPPFAGEEARPVGGAGDAFAVWGAEVEGDWEALFTEAGMIFEGEAVLPFPPHSEGAVRVGDF